MRILVTGSRDWADRHTLKHALLDYEAEPPAQTTVVVGACPTGADLLAEWYAVDWQWEVERHPADWKTYGKAAGFRRNAEMVALGADVCLAFIRNGSRGATHCADLAEKAGIPVRRFLDPPAEPSYMETQDERAFEIALDEAERGGH